MTDIGGNIINHHVQNDLKENRMKIRKEWSRKITARDN